MAHVLLRSLTARVSPTAKPVSSDTRLERDTHTLRGTQTKGKASTVSTDDVKRGAHPKAL